VTLSSRRRKWAIGCLGLTLAGLALVAGVAWLLYTPLDSGRITLASCRPHQLKKIEACWGEDDSWIECHFQYRARGVPDEAFCRGLLSSAGAQIPVPPTPAHDSAPAADAFGPSKGSSESSCFDSAQLWNEVDCRYFSLSEWQRCFSCGWGEHEAGHTYLYATNDTCAAAIEQVTCNVPPLSAAKRLLEAANSGR
jgi:hypothetical protein